MFEASPLVLDTESTATAMSLLVQGKSGYDAQEEACPNSPWAVTREICFFLSPSSLKLTPEKQSQEGGECVRALSLPLAAGALSLPFMESWSGTGKEL